ncbi:MAG: hypothetical protein SWK76_15315 [Actinomycetota bacterium]|nr:hypothetical protein [Actinomycetota bacterium]
MEEDIRTAYWRKGTLSVIIWISLSILSAGILISIGYHSSTHEVLGAINKVRMGYEEIACSTQPAVSEEDIVHETSATGAFISAGLDSRISYINTDGIPFIADISNGQVVNKTKLNIPGEAGL